jgi:poly-gamma-glutamate capsule biosynthesis protein CapA/YwtB (metallophosphatase superfamily)
MVVIHRAYGFRIVIYTADHDPAHIHITGAGQAKINLSGPDGRPEVVSSAGIKQSDMRRLMSEIEERRDEFLKEWERIHGTSD